MTAVVLGVPAAGLAPAAAASGIAGAPKLPQAASTGADDWSALQGLLPSLNGTWSSPPTGQATDKFPGGALLGNGDIGVEVGGNTNAQTMFVSKSDMWDYVAPSGATGSHPVALGGLTLRRPPSGTDSSSPYSLTQDLLNAQVTSDLNINNTPIHTVTYTADDQDAVITQVNNTGSHNVVLDLDTWTRHTGSMPATSGVSGSTVWASRSTESGGAWVSRAAIATRVLGATVTTSSQPVSGDSAVATAEFTVPAGQSVTLVSAVRGGKNATTQVADAISAANALDTTGVATLHTNHLAWWKSYWLKSYVRVYDTQVEKYYYGSQYLLGSAARTGGTAPGLWGAWITSDSPAWNGDYHLNYNVQAPYYGAFSSNRPELATPYIQSITDYESVGQANVAGLQNLPTSSGVSQTFKDYLAQHNVTHGYLYPVGIGPWGASTDLDYWNQPSNASYAAVPMIYRYDYAPDSAYLSGTLYPYLKSLAQFWQDYLGAKGGDGLYHLMGATYEGDWRHDDALDLSSVKLVLSKAVQYSQTLGVDAPLRPAWNDILAHLPAFPTTSFNGKTVYTSDYDTTDFASLVGRTVCNIEWIHPFDLLNLDSPQKARQSAIDTLDAMNSWTQGNNFAKSFGIAAQIGYPANSLFSTFKSVLSAGLQTNGSVYQAGGGLESVGTTDAVNAMLLQSVGGTIRLFPDYPSGRAAHFSNLRVQGGFLVSADYDGATASNVSLTADNSGGSVTVLNPWPGRTLTVTDSTGATITTTHTGDKYTFTTTAGTTYSLTQQALGGGASLTGSVATQPSGTVDLAQEGTTDWAHWGLTNAAAFDHKAAVTPAISNYTVIGSNPVNQLADSQVSYTWAGGTPTTGVTATPTAVYVRSVGNGFRLTVPATATPQRLRVYLGAWSAKGKLTATLSDGSAAPYTGYFDSPSGSGYGLADLTFKAASIGQTLTIAYTVDTSYSGAGDGNITLHAATLVTIAPTTGPVAQAASGLCADIPGADNTDSNQLQLSSCNRTAAQTWTVAADGTLQAMGKCMDVRGGASTDGTPVQIYSCNGTPAQKWSHNPVTSQLQILGKCLDGTSHGTGSGTKLVITTCTTGSSQQWNLP
ncbi:ricin-type beta-trefoil lectin domain protein [Streptomyces sp. NPDC051976]|uniref:glycosyl hydrolase family 95 catalytic domain-containing protein n=1 Tax=Streptomyces sp. NPDC051976 TaxID=3154947 RepID=UPI0034224989